MTNTTLERPAVGTWTIDASHTSVDFVARHLMFAKVRGSFTDVAGTITIGETGESSSVSVEIAPASVDTRSEDRDGHLRSPDFFDVETYPTMTFVSTAVAGDASGFTLTGDLTIKGVTKTVTLDAEYLGAGTDPYGNQKMAFSAHGKIDREDWGLTWNAALETGGVLVSKEIEIAIEIQATLNV